MIHDLSTASPARSMSRSALRHRPIAPDAIHAQVQIRRASRVQQKPKPSAPDNLAFADSIPAATRVSKASGTWLIHIVVGMLCACLLLWIGQMLWNWGTSVSDDLHYGRPRTTQVDHLVGHEIDTTPSHFIAINLSGQVYIIEIPGGSPNTSHLLVGPHLYGPGADLAPITLSFVGDPHHPDLLISVDNIQIRFRNTGSAYVPAPE